MTDTQALRVLILLRYFPPSGGSVQRIPRLAKYLARKPDITVDVVTTALLAEGTVPDPEFAADLPPSITVTRLPARVSTRATKAVAALHLGFVYYRGLRLLGAPDPAILDVPELVRAVLARPKPSVLIAPCPPFSNVIAGMIAAERIGIPWIADMQDPFSRTPMFRPSTVLHRRAMEKLEELVLRRASRVIVVSEEMRARVPKAIGNRLTILENGFDAADLAHFDRTRPAYDGTRPFRLLFVGTLQGSIRLEMLDDLPPGFDLEIVGRALVPPPRSARLRGYVPHREALRAMSGADALVLDLPEEFAFTPASKTYEYLVAGPTVLAIVPVGGAAAKVVQKTQGGVVVKPGDRSGLLKALDDLRAGRVPVAPVEERRARLYANRGDVQATELASLLQDVLGARLRS